MNLELDRLKAFYTVVKAGSFTKAADIMNISQSALSRSVQHFEHRINTKLLIRSPQGLKLTNEGLKLFDFAERTIKEAELLAQQFKDNSNEPQGKLKIATMPATSSIIISNVPEFIKQYPNINITINGNLEDIDLASHDVIVQPKIQNNPDLVQLFLFNYSIRLYASESYLDKFGLPKTVNDLNKHRLIGYSDMRLWKYAQVNWINKLGQKPWHLRNPDIQVSSSDTAVAAAESGLGIIEISDRYKELRSPNLIEILPNIDHPIGDIHYIYRKEFSKIKRISLLGEYLANKFEEN